MSGTTRRHWSESAGRAAALRADWNRAQRRTAQHGTRHAEPRRDRGRRRPHDAWAPQPGGPARGRSLRSRARRPLAPRRPSAAAPPPRKAERPRDAGRRATLPAGGAPRRAAARTSPPARRALPVRSRTAGGASSRWSWPRAAAPRSQRGESRRRRRPPSVPPAPGGSGFSWRSDAGARAPLRRTPRPRICGLHPASLPGRRKPGSRVTSPFHGWRGARPTERVCERGPEPTPENDPARSGALPEPRSPRPGARRPPARRELPRAARSAATASAGARNRFRAAREGCG